MKFLFDYESFSFGPCAQRGTPPTEGPTSARSWLPAGTFPRAARRPGRRNGRRPAARIEGLGRAALAADHRVSAREALVRASNYYRTADFYRRENPSADAESARLVAASQQTFADAAALLDTPIRAVEIPWEGTLLPGYLFLADDTGIRRPTVRPLPDGRVREPGGGRNSTGHRRAYPARRSPVCLG